VIEIQKDSEGDLQGKFVRLPFDMKQ
jgi:hypothetical protein